MKKSEVMVIGTNGCLEQPLPIEGTFIEVVEQFKYLGTELTSVERLYKK